MIVKLESDKKWTDYIGTKAADEYRKIRMEIPDDMLISLSVSATNEDIKITDLSFKGLVNLDANGGNILIERLNVGDSVGLTAKNGDIKGSIVGTLDEFSVSCTIKKGECNLPLNKEGGEKSLTVDCNNGDTEVEFIKR